MERVLAPGQSTSVKMSCFGGGDEALKEQKRQNKLINDQLKKDKDVYKGTHRLLLLGESVVKHTVIHVTMKNYPSSLLSNLFDLVMNPFFSLICAHLLRQVVVGI